MNMLDHTRTGGRAAAPQRAPKCASASSPALSVTITSYNYGRFIPQAIESVLRQTFRDFELIIIDNCSTDDSVDVIRSYAERDSRIRVVEHPSNLGLLASLRESCELARGKYRVHVDADDWVIARDAFERQVELLESHPNMAFTYSAMTMTGRDGRVHNVSRPNPGDCVLPGEVAVEAILGFNITHSGMMFRLDAYRAAGGYPEGFLVCLDVALAALLCDQGDVGYIDDSLYAFGQHGSNDHLAFRPHVVRDEVLPMIALALDSPLGRKLGDPDAVRRRVLRRALVHEATQDIFSGRIRRGWRLYRESARVRPIDTVFQRRSLALLARTMTGHSGYRVLTQSYRRVRKPFRLEPESATS